MKRFNQVSIFISIGVIILNICLNYDLSNHLDKYPNDTANSGVGTAFLFLFRLYGTWAILGLLFLISLALNALNKQLLKPYSLLNYFLLVFAFFIPLLLI